MKVYFIRHGQSQGNLEKRACGWSQSPLSELGHQQAAALAPVLGGIGFDVVYSSDLLRAVQTACDAIPGCQPVQSPLLREICVGDIAGMLRTDCERIYGDVYKNAAGNHDYTPFNGENDDMICDRVFKFMRELEGLGAVENVAVFGHEGTVHQMVNYVIGARIALRSLRIVNCSISVFSYENGLWKLERLGFTASLS
ncbi:MAG: histidine phosphatase family protein [Sphaerochaetaceae bacterium]